MSSCPEKFHVHFPALPHVPMCNDLYSTMGNNHASITGADPGFSERGSERGLEDLFNMFIPF